MSSASNRNFGFSAPTPVANSGRSLTVPVNGHANRRMSAMGTTSSTPHYKTTKHTSLTVQIPSRADQALHRSPMSIASSTNHSAPSTFPQGLLINNRSGSRSRSRSHSRSTSRKKKRSKTTKRIMTEIKQWKQEGAEDYIPGVDEADETQELGSEMTTGQRTRRDEKINVKYYYANEWLPTAIDNTIWLKDNKSSKKVRMPLHAFLAVLLAENLNKEGRIGTVNPVEFVTLVNLNAASLLDPENKRCYRLLDNKHNTNRRKGLVYVSQTDLWHVPGTNLEYECNPPEAKYLADGSLETPWVVHFDVSPKYGGWKEVSQLLNDRFDQLHMSEIISLMNYSNSNSNSNSNSRLESSPTGLTPSISNLNAVGTPNNDMSNSDNIRKQRPPRRGSAEVDGGANSNDEFTSLGFSVVKTPIPNDNKRAVNMPAPRVKVTGTSRALDRNKWKEINELFLRALETATQEMPDLNITISSEIDVKLGNKQPNIHSVLVTGVEELDPSIQLEIAKSFWSSITASTPEQQYEQHPYKTLRQAVSLSLKPFSGDTSDQELSYTTWLCVWMAYISSHSPEDTMDWQINGVCSMENVSYNEYDLRAIRDGFSDLVSYLFLTYENPPYDLPTLPNPALASVVANCCKAYCDAMEASLAGEAAAILAQGIMDIISMICSSIAALHTHEQAPSVHGVLETILNQSHVNYLISDFFGLSGAVRDVLQQMSGDQDWQSDLCHPNLARVVFSQLVAGLYYGRSGMLSVPEEAHGDIHGAAEQAISDVRSIYRSQEHYENKQHLLGQRIERGVQDLLELWISGSGDGSREGNANTKTQAIRDAIQRVDQYLIDNQLQGTLLAHILPSVM